VPKKTLITDNVHQAAELIRKGGLVAFPTETVYGVGADARNADAIAAIYQAKGRPGDNPLIVHVHDRAAVEGVAAEIPEAASRLLERFSPGPLTVVLRRGAGVAPLVSAGLDTVAVRIPSHPTAARLLLLSEAPVAAPSANRSGRPSATTWQAVREDLDGRIDAILVGDPSEVGLESTVVDCTGAVPAVLREGAVTLADLQHCLPGVQLGGGRLEASPGTRHPHYAPRARVRLVDRPHPEGQAGYIGTLAPPPGYAAVLVPRGSAEYAHALYEFFRTCDDRGLERIDCLGPPAGGLGPALLDRISRAAAPVAAYREGSVDSEE
jgi:L-threonylcarbamoyladenylate synthase